MRIVFASKQSTFRSRTISKCSELSWLPSSSSSQVASPKLSRAQERGTSGYWTNYKMINCSESQVNYSSSSYAADNYPQVETTENYLPSACAVLIFRIHIYPYIDPVLKLWSQFHLQIDILLNFDLPFMPLSWPSIWPSFSSYVEPFTVKLTSRTSF